jgi:hypothetical protein
MNKKDNSDLPSQSPHEDTAGGGESKRVIIGNDLKIAFDRERDTTENLWSRLRLPLPDVESDLSLNSHEQSNPLFSDKRADRGRRAISKGNVLAYRNYGPDFMSLVGPERRNAICDAIATLGLTEEASDSLAFNIIFYMAQMCASEDFEAIMDKGNGLKNVLKAVHELIEALRTVSGHPALRASLDMAVSDEIRKFLEIAKIRLFWETTEENARDLKILVMFGSISEIVDLTLSSILTPIAKLLVRLDSANLITNSAEYKFVFEAARLWLAYMSRIPTVSRGYDREDERTPRQPSFQQFIEAIAPEIGSDTIRTTLAAFKAAMGSETDKESGI